MWDLENHMVIDDLWDTTEPENPLNDPGYDEDLYRFPIDDDDE